MLFASLAFVFLFLPLSLAVFYLFPGRYRYLALLGISLAYYILADPSSFPVLCISVFADYLLGRIMEFRENSNRSRKIIAVIMVSKNLLLLFGVFSFCEWKGRALPLGLAIFTLLGIGYAVDIYQGEALYEHNFGKFFLAYAMFFKLPAGPLVRFRNLAEQLSDIQPDPEQMRKGAPLFIQGLAKQVLLGGPIERLYYSLSSFENGEHSVFSLWLLLLAAAMGVYFILSGYCDMARGLGFLFGIRLPQNFYYPYQSRSVSDFVSRFNITVSGYLQTYLFEPLGGDQTGRVSAVLNTVLVTILWGMWFGIRMNYLLWGLLFAVFILLEHGRWGRVLSRIPVFFRRIYTFCIILFSFVIFTGQSLGSSSFYFTGMLGLRGLPVATYPVMYLFTQTAPYLILAVIFSTSLPHSIKTAMGRRSNLLVKTASFVWYGALLLFATGYLLVA